MTVMGAECTTEFDKIAGWNGRDPEARSDEAMFWFDLWLLAGVTGSAWPVLPRWTATGAEPVVGLHLPPKRPRARVETRALAPAVKSDLRDRTPR